MSNFFIAVADDPLRKIFADDVSTYKIVPKNHFAYATNHIEEGSIGYQEILDEALISPMYTVFNTDKTVNDNFFFKLLKSHPLVYQYQNRMEGSIDRRGGLRWDGFSIIKIKEYFPFLLVRKVWKSLKMSRITLIFLSSERCIYIF